MRITLRRTAAVLCAGAIAFAMAEVPAAVASAAANTIQASQIPALLPVAAATSTDENVNYHSDSTEAPSPPIYSPFARHGAVA